MSENPFSAPKSITENSSPSREEVRRPVSVWIFVVFSWIFIALNAYGVFDLVRVVSPQWAAIRDKDLVVFQILWRCAVIIAFIVGGRAMFAGRRWGKWFGLIVLSIYGLSIFAGNGPPAQPSEYGRIGAFCGHYVIVPVLIVWWAIALGFSEKSRRFFRRPSQTNE